MIQLQLAGTQFDVGPHPMDPSGKILTFADPQSGIVIVAPLDAASVDALRAKLSGVATASPADLAALKAQNGHPPRAVPPPEPRR